MNLKLGPPGTALPPLLHMATQAADRLRAMDEQGIDVEALSINPYWYGADRDLARQIIRVQNEKLAEACAAHPDRFVAFATVALQYPELAAEQLEEGVKKYGLRGAGIGGSVNGRGDQRSEVPSVLGQGRAARRARLHPSAGRGRSRRTWPSGSRATAISTT